MVRDTGPNPHGWREGRSGMLLSWLPDECSNLLYLTACKLASYFLCFSSVLKIKHFLNQVKYLFARQTIEGLCQLGEGKKMEKSPEIKFTLKLFIFLFFPVSLLGGRGRGKPELLFLCFPHLSSDTIRDSALAFSHDPKPKLKSHHLRQTLSSSFSS